MTSYLNKSKQIYYYKCNCCNKTINAETSNRSFNIGIHNQFFEVLKLFNFSSEIHDLFAHQLKKIMEDDMANLSERKRLLSKEINNLKESFDKMEYRYAMNGISKDVFDRQGKKLQDEIEQKVKDLEFMPSKKSNLEKGIKYVLKIAENPSKIYNSLNYNGKRKFQSLLFPKGLRYSIKNRKYRTSKTSELFGLTSCFLKDWISGKEKNHPQNEDGSCLVAGTGLEPVTFGL